MVVFAGLSKSPLVKGSTHFWCFGRADVGAAWAGLVFVGSGATTGGAGGCGSGVTTGWAVLVTVGLGAGLERNNRNAPSSKSTPAAATMA